VAARLRLQGTGASPGIGVGSAYLHREERPSVPAAGASQAPVSETARAVERDRLHRALATVHEELTALAAQVRADTGDAEADVFEAQALFLQDPALLDPMEAAIAGGATAAQSAMDAFATAATELEALDDAYLRARAADLRDVSHRLRRRLGDLTTEIPGPRLVLPPGRAILIALDLTPSEMATLPAGQVQGIVLAAGTTTAHAAILARGRGLPLVVGAGEEVWQIAAGQTVLIDGTGGTVLVEPDRAERTAYAALSTATTPAPTAEEAPGPPYRTADGHVVTVLANANTAGEARRALAQGAEGIGLLRSEFLLATLTEPSGKPPEEEALATAYGEILQIMGDRPVVVRAMDAGGDKPLPFLSFGQEENPALGWRGIRVLLDEPALFAAQIRALLRAASRHSTDLRILLPMIATVDEFVRARALIEDVQRDTGLVLPHPLRIGAMIEVPAAALIAPVLARVADFFSLGTNDLVQYTVAGDRGNSRVASLCRGQHPAVLRLIDMTVRAAHAANRPVAVCGEAAGDITAVPFLLGLGVDELSVAPPALAALRSLIRTLHTGRLQEIAAQACSLGTVDEVGALLADAEHMKADAPAI
jgi:phosphoenolpyruvate-protein phosphotransferase